MTDDKNSKSDIYTDFPKLKEIETDKFPKFLFIIPDGNRRYASNLGKPAVFGHKKGFDVAIKLLRDIRKTPIEIVGLWAFSSDNWKRSEIEIKALMGIYEFILDKYVDEFDRDNCRFIHIGRKDRLPKRLVEKLIKAEKRTKDNTGQIVVIALDFGGEDQMVRMLKKAQNIEKTKEITQELMHSLRDGEGVIPTADLIIRTSEIRTSDVGWINGKNTVLYFIPDKFFPQMETKDVVEGIEFFVNTKRRQGA